MDLWATILGGINSVVIGICQLLAMLVIVMGVAKALAIFVKDAVRRGKSQDSIRESRLELGHAFSLGLGFLIGASILKTMLAPTWTDIGQLAAIIALRTGLNYFLFQGVRRPAVARGPSTGSRRRAFRRPPPSPGTRPAEAADPAGEPAGAGAFARP
jgi:uncharacterized membrane protein